MNAIEAAMEGRLGQAPTLRTSQNGKAWCSFTVAVGKDDDTTWVGVTVFGSQAETIAAANLEKGAQVYVEGRLTLSTWTGNDGVQRTGLKVAATLVQPLGQIGRRKPAKASERGRERQEGSDIPERDAAAQRDWQRPSSTSSNRDSGYGGYGDSEIPF